MSLPSDLVLQVLRAVGEDSRLRIAALLRHGELTVTDLTDILGQSQPRISRHLKLLADAGVVEKHREGSWVFFELVGGPYGELVDDVVARIDENDAVIAGDRDRLDTVRARRAEAAHDYFARIADEWDEVRSLHAAEEIVESAIVGALGERHDRSLLDLGTGTGRMLQLLTTPHHERAVGIDTSHSMLAVARANLERATADQPHLRTVELRQGDIYSPPVIPGAFDLVVIHQVLHFLDDPGRALSEAARAMRPGGRLLVVDFAPHSVEFLRTDHAHRRLGLRSDAVDTWFRDAGLRSTARTTIHPKHATGDALTVEIWLAEQVAVPTTRSLREDAHPGEQEAEEIGRVPTLTTTESNPEVRS